MKEKSEIDIKGCFEVLSLFFLLATVSIIMVYSTFDRGVSEFWKNKIDEEKYENESIVSLDEGEMSGDVWEIEKGELVFEYIDSKGEAEVFWQLFEEKTEWNNGEHW